MNRLRANVWPLERVSLKDKQQARDQMHVFSDGQKTIKTSSSRCTCSGAYCGAQSAPPRTWPDCMQRTTSRCTLMSHHAVKCLFFRSSTICTSMFEPYTVVGRWCCFVVGLSCHGQQPKTKVFPGVMGLSDSLLSCTAQDGGTRCGDTAPKKW